MNRRLSLGLAGASLIALGCQTMAQERPAPAPLLEDAFRDPPASARPRVWWHWMNGNITKDGIAKDLAWMKATGIGGVQNFDADLSTPQIVDKRLVYMTPEWKDAFRFAVEEADRLGLEFAIAASPGWSETGGPWVPPQDGMKKLVWSETVVEGGHPFAGKLPRPPQVTGPYQAMPLVEDATFGPPVEKPAPPTYYADTAVVAYRIDDRAAEAPRYTLSGQPIPAAPLTDDDLGTAVDIAAGKGRMIGIDYARAITVRSARLFMPGNVPNFRDPKNGPVLEAQVGGTWRQVGTFRLSDVPTTIGFAPVTARSFRIVLGPYTGEARPSPMGDRAEGMTLPNFFPPADPDAAVKIALLRLDAEDRVDHVEAKAGFTIARAYDTLGNPAAPATGVAAESVVDLTSRMSADGSLDWRPPAGRWRVLRFGYSLTGKTNHPAPAEATGLEVDKMDGAAVRRYLTTYLDRYRDASNGALGQRGIDALLNDSTEVGAFNWTARLPEHFRRLRGYDLTRWLPVLTGALIGSRAESERFLYDFRRTIADLHATEHYGTVADVAHKAGLKVYGEALEDWRPSLGDDLGMRRYADYPMAAMWSWSRRGAPRTGLMGDMKGAASVAHVYGQNIAAAESMTSGFQPWQDSPADLKRVIDLEFAHGINRPVIHTSVHQPVDDKQPGLALAPFIGQYFSRHESWACMARPWIDYIARSSLLLQQGRDVADIAWFIGEEAPVVAQYGLGVPKGLPSRHGFDFVNADALVDAMRVEGDEIVSTGGAQYRALYLGPESRPMTLPTLRRIAALAEAGATIVGMAPTASPSLADNPAAFAALVRQLWPGGREARVGRGRVIAAADAEAALEGAGLAADFEYRGGDTKPGDVLFVHRRLADRDIYFVNNRLNRAVRIDARFRAVGDRVELWRADTGEVRTVTATVAGGVSTMPLDLAGEDSVFVVFRRDGERGPVPAPAAAPQPVAQLDGPWTVTFERGRGGPATPVTLPALASLSEQADPRVRYFSGVATYRRAFVLPANTRPGEPLLLDLGRVGDLAQVSVNGMEIGTVWHAPYRIDIGRAVKAGENRIEVRVANVWVNRLIGDVQPGATRVGWTAGDMYRPDAPLRPSGLIGPVVLLSGDRR
ncbi:glycosyl hydrolase [Sphingomonas yantingensis]|uniref:Beta-mannosidase-like galactose-binding domain-containing protein n=1 Tax=Sphingomonas yantingensis TaxID=1241761 RepID=A0A7W9ARX6_9SPHN|nr:glycosyl hydrolase [Sphingomonas yantingensis]MBB5699467.1 hypothetical protein [Sphingomonas yantingensis]